MPRLDRDGVTVHYEVYGDIGGGAPVLLLTHGYSATLEMWKGQAAALASEFPLITWDLRGHGGSDSPDDADAYSEAHAVADMAGILDACGVERAAIGGLSLGGYLSLAFHVAHPERVRGLLLFDTGPGYRDPRGREQWNRAAERFARRFEERGLDALGGGAEVRVSSHHSAEGLARAARGTLAQFDARVIESLPSIAVPTLVLVGEKDEPFLAASGYMAKKIPGAEKTVLAGAGHAANIDQPQAFNDAVRRFLHRLS